MGRWVPVNEAAIALGVSVATLKRHLKSGKVAGRQEASPSGFRWYVEIPGDDEDQPAPPSAGTNTAEEAREQLIGVLQQQVNELWTEVAARRQEVRELHILLQQAQAQIPIPAAAPLPQLEGQHTAVADDDSAAPPATPDAIAKRQEPRWWQFWR